MRLFITDIAHRYLNPVWFVLALSLLLSLRLFHFGEMIEEPHAWRQYDTANYIHSFATEGMDLFYPKVCWMGEHEVTILEFPLHEALSAILYKLFGASHFWARLMTFLFFLGALRYLYLLVQLYFGAGVARLATLLYAAIPLGLYYSTAVHVDFCAVFLAHAMCWHYIQGLRRKSQLHLFAGCVFAALGFAVKVPYVFYFALLIAADVLYHRELKNLLRNAAWFIVPGALFVLWQWHVGRVNEAAPDWSSVIPEYHKFTGMSGWYFGRWQDRMEPERWLTIWERIRTEIFPLPVLLLAGVGFCIRLRSFSHHILRLWLLGTVAYIAIFFNVNYYHDYYQIPLMAPLAVLVAVALLELFRLLFVRLPILSSAILFLAVSCIVIRSLWFAGDFYYEKNPLFETAGAYVRSHSEEDASLIVLADGLDCRAPHYLYSSRRSGWQIKKEHFNESLLSRLRADGADYLLAVVKGPMEEEDQRLLAPFPRLISNAGWDVGLVLYDLR